MVNTKIRMIIFFVAKDGEALYNQHKQEWELTVAQIMKSSWQMSDLTWGSREHHLAIQVWPNSNTLLLHSVSDKLSQGIRSDRQISEELWTEVLDTVQEVVIKMIPKKKKAKWLSEEDLQTTERRREAKGKGEKERETHLSEEFQWE